MDACYGWMVRQRRESVVVLPPGSHHPGLPVAEFARERSSETPQDISQRLSDGLRMLSGFGILRARYKVHGCHLGGDDLSLGLDVGEDLVRVMQGDVLDDPPTPGVSSSTQTPRSRRMTSQKGASIHPRRLAGGHLD